MVISTSVFLALTLAQTLPPLPAPQSVPKPGPVTDGPYAPLAIMPGGVVIPLYPPGSPFLKADRVKEARCTTAFLQWNTH